MPPEGRQMNGHRVRNRILTCVATLLVSTGAQAQSITEEELKRVEERFEIASDHIAKGNVQARARSEDGAETIYSFDCEKETFDVIFEGSETPPDFPVREHAHSGETLDRTTETGVIAGLACDAQGQPLLGWDW